MNEYRFLTKWLGYIENNNLIIRLIISILYMLMLIHLIYQYISLLFYIKKTILVFTWRKRKAYKSPEVKPVKKLF